MTHLKKSKSLYWFVVGILYILIWETICCIAIESQEIEAEKQIYRDISKSIFQNLQDTIDNNGGGGGQQQDNTNNNENIIKIDKPIDDIANIKDHSIVKDIFNDLPPIYLSFNVSNSSMTLPMNLTADKFDVSNISVNAPYIEFPLSFNADNMTYNITIEADYFPISMNLISNKSDVPISLGIFGAKNIPVNLSVGTLEAPALNYVFYALFAFVNFILFTWVIVQQILINGLKKRLDRIDHYESVIKGKVIKRGNTWYNSINNNDNDDSQQIDHNGNSDQEILVNNSNNNLVSICKRCSQTNGKTKFCFNCGNSLLG